MKYLRLLNNFKVKTRKICLEIDNVIHCYYNYQLNEIKLYLHSNFSISLSHIKRMRQPYHSSMRQKLFQYSFIFGQNRSFDPINIFYVFVKVLRTIKRNIFLRTKSKIRLYVWRLYSQKIRLYLMEKDVSFLSELETFISCCLFTQCRSHLFVVDIGDM